MKLPSITQIGVEYIQTLRRFPLTMISAVIGTVTAIILIERDHPSEPSILFSVILTTILALPLLTSFRLTAEGERSSSGRVWTLQAIGLALLAVYAVNVPTDLPDVPMYYLFRFFAFMIGCSLMLSFLPFLQRGQGNGFWQFNKIVVFRIILAGAFAMVLFSGLGLALAALDNLFGMDIPGERYAELWFMILGLFVVPFILSGIPDNLSELDRVTDYPRALKVLGQYVLSPLVLVYFVILYIYIAKIIVTWSWPEGWVGRLILGFSATGILALFVLDPLREKMENLWIKKVARWYYVILLPLIVMLFLALWRRISEYGITEDRYIGLAIGVWLAFIAGYFLLSRAKSVKMIPASLCVLTFLISFGPWGMFSISERSQIQRLERILVADSIIVDGKAQKAPSAISGKDEVEISAILRYLDEVHGFSGIESWFTESLRPDSAGSGRRFKRPGYVADLMGVEYKPYGGIDPDRYFSVAVDAEASISISGYDRLVRVNYNGYNEDINSLEQTSAEIIAAAADSMILKIVVDSVDVESTAISIRPLIDRLVSIHDNGNGKQIPVEQATFEYETTGLRAKVVMLNAGFNRNDSTVVADSYQALVFYSRKGEE
ncbi:MAG TPA: DUF4153 domain-containing protein [candidate division Zixibacteria bacterium]|nr:DUF4153 domain-containing protein [candidate division Zixibacteria bacterium]